MPALEPIAGTAAFPLNATPGVAAGRGRTRRTGLDAGWLMPDLAMGAAIATLLYLFFLFGGAGALFRDSDAGWHIRNGERILATGTLPRVDPFSFSKAGAPWVAWEWLADVAAGALHQSSGLSGVALLYGLAIAASVWMWFRVNRAAGGNFLLAALFAAPMMSTTNLHWLARPHVFSWLFLLGTVWFCETMPRRLSTASLVAIVALSALWTNAHGSFSLVRRSRWCTPPGSFLRPLIWSSSPAASTRSFLMAGGAALAGTLLNPAGWGLHRHVITYLMDSALLDRIGEFQSFDFHATGAFQIMLALGIGFAGGFASLAARRPDRFLLSVILTAAALRSARALPVAALLLLPLANGSFSTVLSLARGLAQPLRRALDGFLQYGDRLGSLDRRMNGFALIPVIVMVAFAGARAGTGFPADQFPVAASRAVAALPADARIFAPDKFGGYLIYRFAGQRKVFFDGRSDFYGADFLKSYARMVQVRPDWREHFDRWNFTHALLPVDYSLVTALKTNGWKELHRDATAVLLVKGASY